jgi:hypothetical protein
MYACKLHNIPILRKESTDVINTWTKLTELSGGHRFGKQDYLKRKTTRSRTFYSKAQAASYPVIRAEAL